MAKKIPPPSKDQMMLPGLSEEDQVMLKVSDRRINHLATPAFYVSLDTCCVCGAKLPEPDRWYLCKDCSNG